MCVSGWGNGGPTSLGLGLSLNSTRAWSLYRGLLGSSVPRSALLWKRTQTPSAVHAHMFLPHPVSILSKGLGHLFRTAMVWLPTQNSFLENTDGWLIRIWLEGVPSLF